MTKKLIEEYKLRVCNFSSQAEGKWTRRRVNRDGSIDESAIDYALVTDETYHDLTSVAIDEDKIYCPYWEIKEKGVKRIVFSDHCAMVLRFELERGTLKNQQQQKKVWNFEEEGYVLYEEESKQGFNMGDNVTATEAYDEWEGKFKKILRKCFKKKTIGKKPSQIGRNNNDIRQVLKQLSKKGKVQRKVAQSYMKQLLELETRQRARVCAENLRKTMSQLSYHDKFSPNGYWKLRAAAGKKPRREMNSVMMENGIEITGKSGIINAYKNEFEHRLRSRSPEPEWEDYTKAVTDSIRSWLETKCPSSPPFTLEELRKVIRKLKKGKAPGMDGYPAELFKRSGDGVLLAILDLFNFIKQTREVPEQWHVMKIITIYKQKGSKNRINTSCLY